MLGSRSDGNEDGLEAFLRHREVVVLERGDVEGDRFANVGDGFFASAPLANASGQAGAFSHSPAIDSRKHEYLSHMVQFITRSPV
jgi:hypothetical protein